MCSLMCVFLKVTDCPPVPPSSPSDLAVVERSAQNLLLQWNPPAFTGFSPLGGFRVAIRELAGSLIAERILEATVTSYNVTGLQPLQEYTAEVFASNSVGLEGEPANLSAHTISLSRTCQLFSDVCEYLLFYRTASGPDGGR